MGTVDINQINPYIRVATHSVLQKNTVIKERVLLDYELLYVESGRFLLRYGGREHICEKGQFVFIRPSVAHSFSCHFDDVSQPHVHFDFTYDRYSAKRIVSFKRQRDMTSEEMGLMQQDLFREYSVLPFVSFQKNDEALSVFYKIISDFAEKNILSAKAGMTALIDMLIRENFPSFFFNAADEEYDVCEQIKDFIDAGQGFSMTLDDFENQFSYDKFYLERIFKKKFGCGLIAYRNEARLKRACELLKRKSVTDVSTALSYSSIYSFSRAFKNRFSCSPNNFKNNGCLTDFSVIKSSIK